MSSTTSACFTLVVPLNLENNRKKDVVKDCYEASKHPRLTHLKKNMIHVSYESKKVQLLRRTVFQGDSGGRIRQDSDFVGNVTPVGGDGYTQHFR